MIDSSPSSAESSFRELDEVFLQNQTRIWLGEVLNTRLDEVLQLSDLLQDGEILFEVYKVVWSSLLTKCMELRHLKHKFGPFGSRRSSGRYRPYSNVDSFLKICKILGLNDIDLFSPSDVVEKRDIRKVCICIRALSKKARSKQLSVPDFDNVVYSLSMPKNMVGVIRKSLESSQCTLSSSSSYSSRKVSQMKLKQKNLCAPANEDNDDYSSSEMSDEAESRYMGENSFSSAGKFDYADGVNSDLENSPDGQCIEKFKYDHCKSAFLSGTAQPFSQHLENDQLLDKMSSRGGISHVNNDASHDPGNGMADNTNIHFTLENDYSVLGDSSCINDGESNYISDYLAFSDLMVHATDGSNSVIRDGENNMFDFFLNVDSQGLTSNRRSFQNGPHRKFFDDEDMEVSSTTSMSSVLGRLLNLDFDDQFDEDDSLSANGHSSVSKEHGTEKQIKDETNYQIVLSDSRDAQSVEESERSNEQLQNINVGGFGVQGTPSVVPGDMNESQEENTRVANNIHGNISPAAKNGCRQGASHRLPDQRPLLRTVVKGTAIAGVLFLLLHIRKGNDARESKQYGGQVLRYSDSKSSSTKGQKGSVGKGRYPAEKMKL